MPFGHLVERGISHLDYLNAADSPRTTTVRTDSPAPVVMSEARGARATKAVPVYSSVMVESPRTSLSSLTGRPAPVSTSDPVLEPERETIINVADGDETQNGSATQRVGHDFSWKY